MRFEEYSEEYADIDISIQKCTCMYSIYMCPTLNNEIYL